MRTREHMAAANNEQVPRPSKEQLALAAEVLMLLADRTRLGLLCALLDGAELDVTALAAVAGMARPGVSQHLAKLRLAGLVTSRRDGRRALYRLADSHLRAVVTQALFHADHRLTGAPPHD